MDSTGITDRDLAEKEKAKSLINNFCESFPDVSESTEGENCSCAFSNQKSVQELVNRIITNPNSYMPDHALQHKPEFPLLFNTLKGSIEDNSITIGRVNPSENLFSDSKRLAFIPRYIISSDKEITRDVTRYYPLQYALELFYDKSENKKNFQSGHLRRCLEKDPLFGIMTGLSLLRIANLTGKDNIESSDFLKILKDQKFFKFGSTLHTQFISNISNTYPNPFSSPDYLSLLADVKDFFSFTGKSLSEKSGLYKDIFNPVLVLGSSEFTLQKNMDDNETEISRELIRYLDIARIFNRITSHVITAYINHTGTKNALTPNKGRACFSEELEDTKPIRI